MVKPQWALAAILWLGLAATIVWLQRTPDVHSVMPGPQLQAAQARQVLRVGVRSYPRPTDSREALVSEPDEMDSALARALAAYLKVPVQLRALPDRDPQALLKDGSIDVLIAGSLDLPTLEAQSRALDGPPSDYREGRLLALRNAPLPKTGLQGVRLRGRRQPVECAVAEAGHRSANLSIVDPRGGGVHGRRLQPAGR
ncbi:hypothetical protein [Pseudomonas sp. MWU16-30317]|uniref:hypothetical protein n=1 Tax=Pseudomonas sp. MWU16-30317 TaxID=2878095 RepID=UPI001CF944BB|nr:hypothetical protein [Pseudomonas sp. MWU16-30317]